MLEMGMSNLGEIEYLSKIAEPDIAIITNIGSSHMEYLGSRENISRAKLEIVKGLKSNGIVLLNGDETLLRNREELDGKNYRYVGFAEDCDFRAVNVKLYNDSVEYDICGKCPMTHIKVSIPGKFSVYNSLVAVECAYLDGIDLGEIAEAMKNVVVSGKAENVATGRDFSVIIDYAHNPDSFINILTTVRAFAKRTVFLFGCGGDRNRPRALMGKTAGEYADFTIITSDNPRSEDPDSIIKDIEVGIKETGAEYVCITDRVEAIRYAVLNAKPGDVIVLAGKGHETYQIFKDKTVHFDEREVVAEALSELGG